MHKKQLTSVIFLMLFSFYANAAFVDYPVPPEYSFNGTFEIIEPSGSSYGAVPVDFYPATGDFSFDYLGITAIAHDSSIYTSPGTYTFWSTPDSVFPVPVELTLEVGTNQIGLRTFIDWNSNTYDILTVWDVLTDASGNLSLVATDMNGDGIRGYQMVSGPFAGLNAVIDATIVTPIPAAVWLFGSGLLCMFGAARRK